MTSYDAVDAGGVRNGGVSHWHTSLGLPAPGPALGRDVSCDVAIVGGGLTGLWTAYWLKRAEPGLDVRVLEAEFAGYGASGRNGGWLSSELPGNAAHYDAGAAGVASMAAAVRGTVDEVLEACEREGIDADQRRSGVLYVARSAAQHQRLLAHGAAPPSVLLDVEQARSRIAVAGLRGARFDPGAARVHPAKLVRGLADVVRASGVELHESTRVTSISPGRATTARAQVRAGVVLRCMEGFTAGLAGHRRDWLPMNSAIIVTEPLTGAQWTAIGWAGEELLGDEAHAYCYAQRTADGRIALGGRGIPYRFGSRTDVHGRTQEWTIESLRSTLHALFPSLRGIRIDQAWCGVLGVPRDWCASVVFSPGTRLGHAGGYIGSGLTATHLAGRTLADLVLGHETPRTALPWVGHRVRRWEPEPLRWLGVKAMYGLYRAADRREDAGASGTSRWATLADRVSGR